MIEPDSDIEVPQESLFEVFSRNLNTLRLIFEHRKQENTIYFELSESDCKDVMDAILYNPSLLHEFRKLHSEIVRIKREIVNLENQKALSNMLKATHEAKKWIKVFKKAELLSSKKAAKLKSEVNSLEAEIVNMRFNHS